MGSERDTAEREGPRLLDLGKFSPSAWHRGLAAIFLLLALSTTSAAPGQSGAGGLGARFIAQVRPASSVRLSDLRGRLSGKGLRIDRYIAFDQQTFSKLRAIGTASEAAVVVGEAPLFAVVEAPSGWSEEAALAALRADPSFIGAEPDSKLRFFDYPNDPFFGSSQGWHLNNVAYGLRGADINAVLAWDISKGTRQSVIAIIDDGVFYHHADLEDNIWHNPGEIEGNAIDDDGDGLVDNIHGADFGSTNGPDGDPIPIVYDSHGTKVAGAAGAVGYNSRGTIGSNPRTQMMAVKVADQPNGSFPVSATLDAYAFIARKREAGVNIRVVNASYGGPAKSAAAEAAINYLGSLNVLFVAAAGNGGTSEPNYPAAFRLPNVISVAASDQYDRLTSFSNFGPYVDLAAPGNAIGTTVGDAGEYGTGTGTSFAAPLVAGAAALLFDLEPTVTASEARRRILASVDRLSTLGVVNSRGRLNMARLLGLDVPSQPPAGARCPASPATTFPIPFETALALGANPSPELPIPQTAQRLQLNSWGILCNFPLQYSVEFPDGTSRPLTDVWPLTQQRYLTGIIDLAGVSTNPAALKLRVRPFPLYRKAFGPDMLYMAPADARIVQNRPFAPESYNDEASIPGDTTLFASTSALGAARRFYPTPSFTPPSEPPVPGTGWTTLLTGGLGLQPGFPLGSMRLKNAVVALSTPLTIAGQKVTHYRVRSEPGVDDGRLRISFCDRPCDLIEPSFGDLPSDAEPWRAPPFLLTFAIDKEFFDFQPPPGVPLWQPTFQVMSRVERYTRPTGTFSRQTIVLVQSAGPFLQQTPYADMPVRAESSVRIVVSDEFPGEVHLALSRRVLRGSVHDTSLAPRLRVYLKKPDFEVVAPTSAATYATYADPGGAGMIAAYDRSYRFTSAATLVPSFSDVPSGMASFMSVEGATRMGFIGECAPSRFCPTQVVTRSEAAVSLARAVFGRDSRHNFGSDPVSAFSDVPATAAFSRHLGSLEAKQILTACAGGGFCPNLALTRRDLAVWFARSRLGGKLASREAFGVFLDVARDDPDLAALEFSYLWGVVPRCGDDRFCANQPVTRAELAAALSIATLPFSLMGFPSR